MKFLPVLLLAACPSIPDDDHDKDDTILGGDDDDYLFGGTGTDTIDGEGGYDTCEHAVCDDTTLAACPI